MCNDRQASFILWSDNEILESIVVLLRWKVVHSTGNRFCFIFFPRIIWRWRGWVSGGRLKEIQMMIDGTAFGNCLSAYLMTHLKLFAEDILKINKLLRRLNERKHELERFSWTIDQLLMIVHSSNPKVHNILQPSPILFRSIPFLWMKFLLKDLF